VLPAEIGNCEKLEELLLFANSLKVLPKELGKLPKLRVLNLFNNKVMKLPIEVGGLSALEEVNIAANKLMMIPDPAMANWASVTILSLNDNNLVRLGSLEPLKALQELRLFANNLEAMPTLCEGCPIEVMEVHKNRIETIEDDYFKKTPKLKRIIISNNALAAVPPSICDCAELQQLQAADNKLTSLPSGKPWPATLETIFLQGNAGLTALPSELAKLSSLKRCNIGAAGPADLIEKLQDISLEKPDGIFWDPEGKMIKPEDRPKPKKQDSRGKRSNSPGKARPGNSSARGSSPKRGASPGKRAASPGKSRPGK